MPSSLPFAQVIAPRPVRSFFTYSVPPSLDTEVSPGKRVLIPFGSRKLIGLVVSRIKSSDVKTKPILQVIDPAPVVGLHLLELALWIAQYYFAPPGDVAPLILPRDDAVIENLVQLTGEIPVNTRSKTARLVFDALKAKKGARKLNLLAADLGFTPVKMKKILAGDLIRRFTRQGESVRLKKKHATDKREDVNGKKPVRLRIKLTSQQKKAVTAITPDIEKGRFRVHLIHGVTGSGKTEIYARLAAKTVAIGKSALILAPEIALGEMIARKFEESLENVPVTVFHSGLKPAERYKRWAQIMEGEAKVVVGARSALFAPMKNLGLIIVDEEHDPTYKQEESPRYHGRDAAVKRGSLEKVPVALGSATPSLESYSNAKEGKYRLIELTSRIDDRPMPQVEIVEPDSGSDIGPKLRDAIQACLKSKEQALLFLNRRGAARFIQCSRCGHVFICRNCSLSLILHAHSRSLKCHTCGYHERAPDVCCECGSESLFKGGSGTQKIEQEITELFPKARVARMDRDTTTKRGSSATILSAVESRSIDILIGTQMITKGHDFPGINVVGVVSADELLYLPDFRSAERTFQQITQAAGRAGRAERKGIVIVQTLSGDHHSVTSAKNHDYRRFYKTEIDLRRAAGYPPFSRLARIGIEASTVERGELFLEKIEPAIKITAQSAPGITILGPVEAVVFKVRNRYRWRMLFKAVGVKALFKGVRSFIDKVDMLPGPVKNRVKVVVDVDPADVM